MLYKIWIHLFAFCNFSKYWSILTKTISLVHRVCYEFFIPLPLQCFTYPTRPTRSEEHYKNGCTRRPRAAMHRGWLG